MIPEANELKRRLKQTLVKSLRLKLEPEGIGDLTRLGPGGLNLDSVDFLTLLAELEDQYQFRVPDAEMQQLTTVQAIADYIQLHASAG